MHQSVGIQPTQGFNIKFSDIAKACGYNHTEIVTNELEFTKCFDNIKTILGPIFIEIRVSDKSNYSFELPRPKISPIERKNNFIKYLNN